MTCFQTHLDKRVILHKSLSACSPQNSRIRHHLIRFGKLSNKLQRGHSTSRPDCFQLRRAEKFPKAPAHACSRKKSEYNVLTDALVVKVASVRFCKAVRAAKDVAAAALEARQPHLHDLQTDSVTTLARETQIRMPIKHRAVSNSKRPH